MIQLTKEQTYNLVLTDLERNRKVPHTFVTKLKWYCLRCTTPIFIDYKRVTKIKDIYCEDCCEDEMNGEKNRVKKNIQLRFIQQIDTKKLQMFDHIFKNI